MKKKVAIVTGGYSGESVVSYKSAKTIMDNLDTQLYESFFVDINPKEWVCIIDKKKYIIDKNNFSIKIKNKTIHFDFCYIVIHGTPGEDGKLQGYFDMIKMPYVSCNAAVSALTFNKKYTTALAQTLGINVAKSIVLYKKDKVNIPHLLKHLSLPVFVKPNNGGSSLGTSKVTEKKISR